MPIITLGVLLVKIFETRYTSARNGGPGDSVLRVWNVTISEDNLTWNVNKNTESTQENIVWDATEHKYEKEQVPIEDPVTTFSCTDNTKSFTIQNNSNFDVGAVSAWNKSEEMPNGLITITGNSTVPSIVTGDNAVISLSLSTVGLTPALVQNNGEVTTGSITVTLTSGDIYANAGNYEAQ